MCQACAGHNDVIKRHCKHSNVTEYTDDDGDFCLMITHFELYARKRFFTVNPLFSREIISYESVEWDATSDTFLNGSFWPHWVAKHLL